MYIYFLAKVSVSVRRRNLNNRLSKVLTPKSALILLNELKPGCTYKIQEQPASNPVQFMTQVEYKGEVLGVGQGMSKAHSKTLAAENAIKLIVSKRLTQTFSSPNQNTKVILFYLFITITLASLVQNRKKI